MEATDRRRLISWITTYAVIGLAWAGVAWGGIAPLIVAEHPGPSIAAIHRFLHVPPAGFLRHEPAERWSDFAGSVLIALALHLSIVILLDRSGRDSRALKRALSTIAAAFLGVAVLSGIRQDYYAYLEIWYHVCQGNDPWFDVVGMNGIAPLNAYGPLFNAFALLAWLNPVAPRLALSYVYLLFAIRMTLGSAMGPRSWLRDLARIVLFWNPYCWNEIPFFGHFDVLVGLACLGAVLAWEKRQDVRAGAYLAMGVLLKYLPLALLPFPIFERDRLRPRIRFVASVLGLIALGLVDATLIWGSSWTKALDLAANRPTFGPSIYVFLFSRYSPIVYLSYSLRLDKYSMIFQLLGLGCVWWWSRAKRPDMLATTLAATIVLVIFYRVGFPQYQMVAFVLGSAWLLLRWDCLRHPIAPAVAMTLLMGWLSVLNAVYTLSEAWGIFGPWFRLKDAAGFPTFLLGCLLLGCVVHASRPRPTETAPTSSTPSAPSAGLCD